MPPETADALERLRAPIAVGILLMWLAAGVTAIVRSDVQVFVIATGPFGMLCGYLFGANLFKRIGRDE